VSDLAKVIGAVVLALVAATGASACKFDPPPSLDDIDARVDIDAMPDAAPATCAADTIVCENGRYVECSSDGTVAREMTCSLGCAPDVAKCLDVDPSNALAPYLDMAPTSEDVAFAGTSTINTSTGVVVNAGVSITVPNQSFGGMRVFMFKSLSIDGTLKVSGSDPLAIVVDGAVTITGLLDVSADGSTPGPGIRSTATACDGKTVDSSSTSLAGGGGGGRYQAGGKGGDGGSGAGGAGGSTLNDADLVSLQGGCRGGSSNNSSGGILYGSAGGGGGGGSVQIVSRTQIVLSGSGKIDASGGGGRSATEVNFGNGLGGGGGGSGGAVLLEAPQILLDGSGVVISAKGGGGAAAGTGAAGHHGSDGGTASGAAAGGTNGTSPAGGSGGTETLAPTAGANSTTSGDGAGGGGSVGQARFNNIGATVVPQNGAAIRSRYTAAPIGSRQVP